jgi:RNA polymerase sigma-70 factor (ECF subfamily)
VTRLKNCVGTLQRIETTPALRIRMTTAAFAPSMMSPLGSAGQIDFSAHRSAMLRFARRKIRDEDLAEDAVQDALVAALSSKESFQGRSALRTWLIGILNHKIQDVFRRESRYVRRPGADRFGDEGAMDDSPAEVLAAVAASDQRDPVNEVGQRRMRAELAREIDALPDTLREVFVLQVIEGLPTAEVCRRLGITEANCWVRLHRARKRLSERMRDHLG